MTLKQRIEQLEQYLNGQIEANKILKNENEILKNELRKIEPQKYLDTEIENFFNLNIGIAVKNYLIKVINKEIDEKLENFEKQLDEKTYLLKIGEEA